MKRNKEEINKTIIVSSHDKFKYKINKYKSNKINK